MSGSLVLLHLAGAVALLLFATRMVRTGVERAYGDVLRTAGVPVQLELWRGVIHDFIKMGRSVPEARLAHAAAGHALREAFAP